MPSSITSAPAPGNAFSIASDVSRSGSPAVRKVTRAERPPDLSSAKRLSRRLACMSRRELHHSRKRMRGLERRNDTFEARAELKGGQRLFIGCRKVFYALDVAQPRMLRTDARIIEARRNRMRLFDLPVAVHEEIGAI